MWTCRRCGEKHQEQFDACWKCAGADLPRRRPETVAGPPRSLTCALRPALLGLAIGACLAGLLWSMLGASFASGMAIGGLLGAGTGAALGVLSWILYPFEPTANSDSDGPAVP
jgi:hypothetical protein